MSKKLEKIIIGEENLACFSIIPTIKLSAFFFLQFYLDDFFID